LVRGFAVRVFEGVCFDDFSKQASEVLRVGFDVAELVFPYHFDLFIEGVLQVPDELLCVFCHFRVL